MVAVVLEDHDARAAAFGVDNRLNRIEGVSLLQARDRVAIGRGDRVARFVEPRAGGDEDGFSTNLGHGFWRSLSVEADIDLEASERAGKIVSELEPGGAIREPPGKSQRATELAGALQESHVMTTLGRRLGELHPGRTAADHEHRACRIGGAKRL